MAEGRLRLNMRVALVGYVLGGLTGLPAFALEPEAVGGAAYAAGLPSCAAFAPDLSTRGSALCDSAANSSSAASHSLKEIAAELRTSYENLQGLSMSFRQVNSWADMPESGETSQGRLWAARGGKLRMEYSEPPGHLLVSDGWRVWVYVPENKQAVVDSVGGDGQSALAEMLLRTLDEGEAQLLGEELVGRTRCYVITAEKPEDPPGIESLTIWVDPGSWLTRALELRDLNDNVTKFCFSEVKRLDAVEAKLFSFEAPPGVEVVESPLSERGSR